MPGRTTAAVIAPALRRPAVALAFLGAALAVGCAARWNGPAPPVLAAPAAEPASSAERSGIPSGRLWTYKHNTFLGAAPVAVGPHLAIVDHKGRIVFIDPNSGKVRARAKTKYPLEDAPAWDSDRFYVVHPAPRRRLEALRFADGRIAWRRDFTGALRRPILYRGDLVVAAGDSVFALEPTTGRMKRLLAVSEGTFLDPVAADSGLLMADARGKLRLLDTTGEARWERDLAMFCDAPPAVDGDGFVYVGRDGQVVKLDEGGREMWRDTIGAAPLYTPAIEGERVFVVGRDGTVTALDLATGAEIWQRTLSAPGADGLEVQPNWVATGSIDGVLWLLDPVDGNVLDTLHFGELIHEPPVRAFGRLFVVTENKKLHALGQRR